MIRDLAQEGPARSIRKSQGALTRFILDQEQVVGLPKRAWGLAHVSGTSGFRAHHQGSSPAIGSRVAHGAKEALARRGVMRRSVDLRRRFQGKTLWIPKPLLVIPKGGSDKAKLNRTVVMRLPC